MTMREMVDKLNKWAYEYYVLDNPTVADSTYDALYDQLVALEKAENTVLFDSPTQRVGGQPLKKFEQHKHLKQLFSLDKAQTFLELKDWIEKVNKEVGEVLFSVELKYDGLTISATYENGKLVSASTRGNGITGEVVTEQVKTIKSVPLSIDFLGKIEVQGEGIMRKSMLESYNVKNPATPLKNARNAAAGAIRNLDPKITASRNLDVVFYSMGFSEPSVAKNQNEFVEFLKTNNFKTNQVFKTAKTFSEVKQIILDIEKQREGLDFLIDGVVVKVDDFLLREELGFTSKFPKWAVAFKFDAEQVTTKLLSVDWQVGRTGKITPIANLLPVELCGATIKRATLNNNGDISRKNLSTESMVFVRRSNDVIPEILGLAEETENSQKILPPKECPACKTPLTTKGAHIFCLNHLNCRPQIVARLVHFCSKNACDIEGISEKTVETFVDKLGIKMPSDLYSLKSSDFVGWEGFKDKKINNLLASIEKSKKVELPSFIFALGIDNVGVVTARDLAAKFFSLENLSRATVESLLEVEQIGDVVAQSIVDFFLDDFNVELVENLKNIGINPRFEKVEKSGVFSGRKVVLTGSLNTFSRSQASKFILENGGEVLSAVTKACNLVVAGSDAGSKLQKAEKLQIEVIDEQQFLKMLDIKS